MQGIMSGLEPIPQRNEEEVLKQMLKDRSILELEDRLGIKIPISTDQSEEDLINRILQMTGRSISKRGDEFVYAPTRPNFGKDDGLSFYVNPKINGAGIRYNKKFADGGVAALAEGGFPDLSGDGKITQKDILMGRGVIKKANGGIAAYADGGPLDVTNLSEEESQMLENIFNKLYLSDYDSFRTRRSPDYSKITDEEFDFLMRYDRGKVARDMPLLSRYQERVGFYPGGKAFEESDGLPMKEFGASTGIAMLATIPKQLRKAFYGKEYMSNPIEERIKAEARDMADKEYNELMGRKDGGMIKLQEGGDAGTKYFGKDGLLFDPTNPLDYVMAVPGLGLAGMGIKALMVGNRLRKAKKALEPVAKLSNPTTNVAGLGALGVDLGTDPEIQQSVKDIFGSQSYSDMYEPGVAYYDSDYGYFEYDPNDDEIYILDEIPEGYRIEK